MMADVENVTCHGDCNNKSCPQIQGASSGPEILTSTMIFKQVKGPKFGPNRNICKKKTPQKEKRGEKG